MSALWCRICFTATCPPHHEALAFAETLAHVNTLVARGALRHVPGQDGLYRLDVVE